MLEKRLSSLFAGVNLSSKKKKKPVFKNCRQGSITFDQKPFTRMVIVLQRDDANKQEIDIKWVPIQRANGRYQLQVSMSSTSPSPSLMMRQNKRRNVTSATRFLCDALLV
jgi:hypothetical protein